jgi:DNA modification methylase
LGIAVVSQSVSDARQLSLLEAVEDVFAEHEELDTDALYREVQKRLPEIDFDELEPIGRAGTLRSRQRRAVRWAQQTLKSRGWVERVQGRRGRWRVTREGRKDLSRLEPGVALLAFNTQLGVALWGDALDAAHGIRDSIHLVLTSPPYPIAEARAYGGARDERAYVDWLCAVLEPLVERLADGGSIVLNVSNDVFEPGLPSRSLYRERLVLALHDRLGLHKMDEICWNNPSKPPGPIQWASKQRCQLNVSWEPVYWFTNNPSKVRSDNRRVLEPHTKRQQKLIEQGGTRRNADYGDGAYRLRPGAFSNPTAGRIARNVRTVGHSCVSQRNYKRMARAAGLPPHGAPMPLSLARWLIRFLTRTSDLVVDFAAGSLTTGLAAELEGRRWVCMELHRQYLAGGSLRFEEHDLVDWKHPALFADAVTAGG